MFSGASMLNLDGKGRLVIPMIFRDELVDDYASQLVATASVDRSILLYPKLTWKKIACDLDNLPSQNPNVRRLQRLMIGYATEVAMDGQGRVLLPPALRKHVNLEKSIAFVGQGKKFEIFNQSIWEAQWGDDAVPIDENDPVFDNLLY